VGFAMGENVPPGGGDVSDRQLRGGPARGTRLKYVV